MFSSERVPRPHPHEQLTFDWPRKAPDRHSPPPRDLDENHRRDRVRELVEQDVERWDGLS
jgi:hypothetical protein